jgi:hypothetical protein
MLDDASQEEMLRYQERTGSHRLLRLDAFADHTTKVGWEWDTGRSAAGMVAGPCWQCCCCRQLAGLAPVQSRLVTLTCDFLAHVEVLGYLEHELS